MKKNIKQSNAWHFVNTFSNIPGQYIRKRNSDGNWYGDYRFSNTDSYFVAELRFLKCRHAVKMYVMFIKK